VRGRRLEPCGAVPQGSQAGGSRLDALPANLVPGLSTRGRLLAFRYRVALAQVSFTDFSLAVAQRSLVVGLGIDGAYGARVGSSRG
jgi:hypothetical protein